MRSQQSWCILSAMIRRAPLITGEVYHVFNRGAHKADVFSNDTDRDRFLLLLYLANDSKSINLRELGLKYKGRSFADAFSAIVPEKPLVDVLAYCLMPNHFHLMLRQKIDGGISTYIKKVATAYSMYFNGQYDHSGTLFQGRFKSSHVDNEPYFRYLLSYIHLNPLELIEPQWKEGKLHDAARAREFLTGYRYSSFYDYTRKPVKRPERAVLSYTEIKDFLRGQCDLEEELSVFNNSTTKDGPLCNLDFTKDRPL